MLTKLLSLGSLALVLFPSQAQAQGGAMYQVTFDATWSQATHPGAYPGPSAHFSPLIGATHSSAARLWQPGTLASNGIEAMAETGSTGSLTSEINALLGAGTAGEKITGGAPDSPGMTSTQIYVTEDHPLVSMVTMIAPSPDWFVGVDSLSLMQNGEWVDLVVELPAWDSGTDSGVNFNSPNQDTNPADLISLVSGGPFFGNDPLGTFTFTRIPVGTNYCGPAVPNSTGSPASILALGTGDAGDDLTLAAEGMPMNQFGYFVVSASTGSVTPPGSSGVLCLSGNIGRFNGPGQVSNSGMTGTFSIVADTNSLPLSPSVAVQPGDTYHFQAWYRDAGGTSNFTDGTSILFQ